MKAKTFRYTTRENAVWWVRGCVPLPHAPGFWIGYRQGDEQQVVIHEHRATEVKGAGDKLQVEAAEPVTCNVNRETK